MRNNPICTSIEQSQRLIDAGVESDTADMYYIMRRNCEPRLAILTETPSVSLLNAKPAWSLSALINLLPDFVKSGNTDYCLTMLADRVTYWNPNATNVFEATEGNLLDAVVEAVVWLTENEMLG